MDTLNFTYQFEFKDGRQDEFSIELDETTLTPVKKPPADLPEWTKLDFKQCEGCPLSNEHTYCPLAVQISPLVDSFKNVISIEEIKVDVIFDDRVVTRETTAQEGISSMMGLVIAVSGCPLTSFFKPMARFHLPFANMEETFYRAASMYMLGQYYRWQNDLSADMDMKGLSHFYDNVATVNKGMSERIRATKREDGAINALVLLDMFVKSLPDGIEILLDDIKPLFDSYLKEKTII